MNSRTWIGWMAIAAGLIITQSANGFEGASTLKHYTVHKALTPITVDGVMDEFAWESAQRVDGFTRILYTYPNIDYPTQAAMLWDDTYFYFAFSCVDPDMWTTKFNRDDHLWEEEVVEVFIDPDGDAKNYLELEVNPLNVVVDLKILQLKPEWKSDIEWNIEGLKTAVKAHGTVNDSTDVDQGWTCEIAIPWTAFKDIPGASTEPPKEGEQWRLNLYRIERVGGVGVNEKIRTLNDQLKAAKEARDCEQALRLKDQIQKLNFLTEYTCWSGTYERGFHDPARFGIVEFAAKRHIP